MVTPTQGLLVFPIDMPQSQDFAGNARRLGIRVLAASSEPDAARHYSDYPVAHLPYVTAPDFDQAFTALLQTHDIDTVFAPHPAIWWHLGALGQSAGPCPPFRICNDSPYEMDWQSYDAAYRWAADCASAPGFATAQTPAAALPVSCYAGLYRGYNQIPGQSDNAKLCALAQVARRAPAGDIVEIGALYGKSAFALAWLARFHHLGSVLCIDPWEAAAIQNQGSGAGLINAAVRHRDWQKTFLGFAASLAVFDNVNYLRLPSVAAAERYRSAARQGHVASPEFGRTPVQGSIALLHIDGNHHHDSVRQDLAAWQPFVRAGGWILFDDYQWAFGDGPRRIGDSLLASGAAKTAFTAADTLFVQM